VFWITLFLESEMCAGAYITVYAGEVQDSAF